MTVRKKKNVGRWYYVILAFAVVWNLVGVSAFVLQLMTTPDTIASLPPGERELYENIPLWATVAFGVAVLGGTLGSIGLLMRKQWGLIILWLSLVGVLVQMFQAFLMSNMLAVYGPTAAVMPTIIIIVAIALVILGRNANTRHWLD